VRFVEGASSPLGLLVIAFIAGATVARRILEHFGLDSRGPPVAGAAAGQRAQTHGWRSAADVIGGGFAGVESVVGDRVLRGSKEGAGQSHRG
jgi:hypothetical protein